MNRNSKYSLLRTLTGLILVIMMTVSLVSCKKKTEPEDGSKEPEETVEPSTPSDTAEPEDPSKTDDSTEGSEGTIIEDEGDLVITIPEDEDTFGE